MIATPVGPASGPLYIADEKGVFEKHNLKAKLVPFTSGRLAFDALLAGEVHVAAVAEAPLVLAAFQSHDFVILATMTKSHHKAIFRTDSIKTVPGDLPGKTLAALNGSAGQFWMHAYLSSVGVKLDQVTTVNLQPADMISALATGAIDGFFSWEPYPYLASKQMANGTTIIDSKGIPDYAPSSAHFSSRYGMG